MSFNREKREVIRRYILSIADDGKKRIAGRCADAFGISENSVYRYLTQMTDEGILVKKQGGYRLKNVTEEHSVDLKSDTPIDEIRIYESYVEKFISDLPDNVRRIWSYSFSEMMNNAIEHSEGSTCRLVLTKDYLNTGILISDDGVGIFKKISDFCGFEDHSDAIAELFKGKLTTDRSSHSGEGIFFTSRMLDEFAISSDGLIFTHNKFEDMAQRIEKFPRDSGSRINVKGTTVFMKLSNYTGRTPKEVFDRFSDADDGFTKTSIPVCDVFNDYPVSRSQARRLTKRLDQFKEVELDFSGCDDMGQGFAHELFIVYGKSHPETTLIPVNMSPDVERMLRHVKNS